MKIKIFFLASILVISLACSAIAPTSQPQVSTQTSLSIGYDFSNQTPTFPEGDGAAPNHIFVHKYPIPSDGFITGVTFLNDSDSLEEDFTLLILHPISGGWEVIHRMDISEDDHISTETGSTTIPFGNPLAVRKGDIFAHWQFSNTGAIPLNDEGSAYEGLSFGKFGLESNDIEQGKIIPNENYSGGRDYFINLIFDPSND